MAHAAGCIGKEWLRTMIAPTPKHCDLQENETFDPSSLECKNTEMMSHRIRQSSPYLHSRRIGPTTSHQCIINAEAVLQAFPTPAAS
eukprot:NODE_25_length_4262_cov_2.540508.p8 GENE.NODE_25_length_4262_cov_2.540508~~NODE_25_length_4262_cov_2.540508.p8  ORF type:complete len:87 (-),score=0.65 NODE_25_length_4262_cov_2.540508:674-934(-)